MGGQGWLFIALVLAVAAVIYFWIRMERAYREIDGWKMLIGDYRATNLRLLHDERRLDWLEQQQRKCPELGHVIFRWSQLERGWRLHQTTRREGVAIVRGAIDIARKDDGA